MSTLSTLAAVLFTIAAAVRAGAVVFQAAVVAPSVFKYLDDLPARDLLRGLFPRFFRLGLVCGAAMLAGALLLLVDQGINRPLTGFAGAALALLVLEGLSLKLIGPINTARDAGRAGATRFRRLHRLSVLMTMAILSVTVALLVSIGASSALVGTD